MEVGKGVLGIAQMALPGFVINGFKLFHSAHRVWYWQQRFETLIRNQEAMEQYGKGMLVSVVVDHTPLKKPFEELANIASFGRTMLQSISSMYALVDSYQELVEEVYQAHLFRVKIAISEGNDPGLAGFFKSYDPALDIWARTYLHLLAIRIEKLVVHTIALCWAAFTLSSSLAELVEKYSANNEFAKMDQKNRLFLNLSDIMEELKRNQEVIEQEFKRSRQMIDNFLQVIGSERMVTDIKAFASRSVSVCESRTGITTPIISVANATIEGVGFLSGHGKENFSYVMVSGNSIEKKVILIFRGMILTV